jgi:hypothetical protein
MTVRSAIRERAVRYMGRALRTSDGRTVYVTTRNRQVIRIGVRDREGRRTAWEVFAVPEIEALERALKAAREKIARKVAKKGP